MEGADLLWVNQRSEKLKTGIWMLKPEINLIGIRAGAAEKETETVSDNDFELFEGRAMCFATSVHRSSHKLHSPAPHGYRIQAQCMTFQIGPQLLGTCAVFVPSRAWLPPIFAPNSDFGCTGSGNNASKRCRYCGEWWKSHPTQ